MPPYAQMPAAQPGATSKIVGSEQQLAIWDAFINRKEHIIIKALAGTGKTTTGVEGLRPIVAQNISAAFLAFNKSIATELQAKVPSGAKAQTFHGAGFGACRNQFGELQVDADRVYKMLPDRMPRHTKSTIIRLTSICKNTLCDGKNKQDLLDLCAQYDIDLYDTKSQTSGQQPGWATDDQSETILALVPEVLEKCKTPTGSIDFDDMIWLPVIWNLPVRKYDFLVVDELQDLNACQQVLALMIGRRIVMVGDEHQAIYAFRGADSNSMENMALRLTDTQRGLITLPLTITRRCPQLVTLFAKQIVPEFECLPGAPMGKVCLGEAYATINDAGKLNWTLYPEETGDELEKHPGWCKDDQFHKGDMVLCRVNAPLIQAAYLLIRKNVPCKIQGRDFGKGLENLIKKLVPNTASTIELLRALLVWASKEREKIEASSAGHQARLETQLGTLQDKVDCIEALTEGLDTAEQVVSRISLLFQDVNKTTSDPSSYVLLSSIHRAKGLEARTVRVIKPELLPHPAARTPSQKQQEMNLKYVAITRSLDTLHFHD